MTPYKNFKVDVRPGRPYLDGSSSYGVQIRAEGGGDGGQRIIDSIEPNYQTRAAALAAGRERVASIKANQRTSPNYPGRRTLAGSLEQ